MCAFKELFSALEIRIWICLELFEITLLTVASSALCMVSYWWDNAGNSDLCPGCWARSHRNHFLPRRTASSNTVPRKLYNQRHGSWFRLHIGPYTADCWAQIYRTYRLLAENGCEKQHNGPCHGPELPNYGIKRKFGRIKRNIKDRFISLLISWQFSTHCNSMCTYCGSRYIVKCKTTLNRIRKEGS